MSRTPAAAELLRGPTLAGQTSQLARLDGAVVARVLWDVLPYDARAAWGERARAVPSERLAAYLRDHASPAGLALAGRNPDLGTELRTLARMRLGQAGLPPASVQRLERHLRALLRGSRARLLAHLSGAGPGRPELDRLDLLAEVVAVREAQAEVRAERSLTRAFRALFAVRDPFVVWVIVALGFAIHLVFRALDAATAQELHADLALAPSWARPWTLVTHAFVHTLGDWRHVTLNMLALGLVGPVIEAILGHARFAATYLALAAGAGLASVAARRAFDVPFATVGASGAVAGLAGLALFWGLWFQGRYGRVPLRYSASTVVGSVVLASNALIAAAAGDVGIDHGAHLGGLALGVGLGAALRGSLSARADARFGR